MKHSNDFLRTFLCSLTSTILFIFLLTGFVLAEKNTRSIAFGDNSPFFICEHKGLKIYFIKIHFMGKDYIIDKK